MGLPVHELGCWHTFSPCGFLQRVLLSSELRSLMLSWSSSSCAQFAFSLWKLVDSLLVGKMRHFSRVRMSSFLSKSPLSSVSPFGLENPGCFYPRKLLSHCVPTSLITPSSPALLYSLPWLQVSLLTFTFLNNFALCHRAISPYGLLTRYLKSYQGL